MKTFNRDFYKLEQDIRFPCETMLYQYQKAIENLEIEVAKAKTMQEISKSLTTFINTKNLQRNFKSNEHHSFILKRYSDIASSMSHFERRFKDVENYLLSLLKKWDCSFETVEENIQDIYLLSQRTLH